MTIASKQHDGKPLTRRAADAMADKLTNGLLRVIRDDIDSSLWFVCDREGRGEVAEPMPASTFVSYIEEMASIYSD